MMQRFASVLSCSLLVGGVSLSAASDQPTYRGGFLDDGYVSQFDLVVGTRILESPFNKKDAIDDEVLSIGLQYQVIGEEWPIGLSLGIDWVEGEGDQVGRNNEIKGREYRAGVLWPVFHMGRFSIEVVGGLVIYDYELSFPNPNVTGESNTLINSIEGFGGYAQGAFRYTVGEGVDLFALGRYGFTQVDTALSNQNENIGGAQVAVGVGLRF